MCVCVLREEAQDDEGTEEAAPPRRVHAHGGGGFPAYWACSTPSTPSPPSPEASQWKEADARHLASTCTLPQGLYSKKCAQFYLRDARKNSLAFFLIGQHGNSGIQPRPAVVRHRLHLQIPHDPQNSAWPAVQCTFLIGPPECDSDVCCFTSAQRTRVDPPSRPLRTAVLAGGGPLRRRRPRLGPPARLSSESHAVVFVSRMLLRSGPPRILTCSVGQGPEF